MNKAFEKILDQLDEASVLRANSKEYFNNPQNGEYVDDVVLMKDAIKIVNEVAEEYKDGWIPCSERLPEEPFGCLVTVIDCEPVTQTDFENILPYFVGYDGESWNDEDGNEIPFEVIAWKPLPEPYKESDE